MKKATRKYPPEVYQVVKLLFTNCNVCFARPPEIEKKKITTKARYRVHRTSSSSFTLMCLLCGIHSTITWKSLAEALGKRADAIAADDEYEEEYGFYAKAFEVLEKNVDISGVIRPTPKQKMLQRLLSDKIK